ncbi:hypothetical protein GS429_20960 [Natronorubrum sp. JWXQ-INN-674]|uniref:Uncharacterized protein n=1 Tax=Natronorubrum halalkaliphilum TaxID=2691917 RepID=A0A6B0VSV6_9EURY|nr:hypothetical protein [Natronorubrum halalkaliphilum]MXV64495.1 hypothetical protein [Natronorubrum halalkaliphilum]
MYSSSRGILYTAPPKADEADENRGEDAATETVATEDAIVETDDATVTAGSEATTRLAADD